VQMRAAMQEMGKPLAAVERQEAVNSARMFGAILAAPALIAVSCLRFAIVIVAVMGCSSHEPGRIPVNHRAVAAACSEARGPGSVTGMANCPHIAAACGQDSDCAAGKSGRCFSDTHGCTTVSCSYDSCSSDADCADNEACGCRMSAMDSTPTVCVSAECRTDADCSSGGFCSPSLVGDPCVYPTQALCMPGDGTCSPGPCLCGDGRGHGYFCHTPSDTCLDDSDCDTSNESSCGYDRLEKRWTCTGLRICPT
jgi:hypothetical protein